MMMRIISILAFATLLTFKADCQSQFIAESDLIEYLDGTWSLDIVRGGFAGVTLELPHPFYFDSTSHVFVFDASEDNQTLSCKSFINDTLFQETIIDVRENPAQIELPRWQLFNLPDNLCNGADFLEELGFYGFSQDTMVLTFNLGSEGFEHGLSRQEPSSTNNLDVQNIKIFPNPTSDWLRITFEKYVPKKIIVVLYDIGGAIVMTHELQRGSNKLDLSLLEAGPYFYEVIDEDVKIESGKIVKL